MKELTKKELVEYFLDGKIVKKGCIFSWRAQKCTKNSGRFFILTTGNIYQACKRHLPQYVDRALRQEKRLKEVEERIKRTKK